MAKGGNSQRSNGSRFTKPYNASNSFVTKVASRVSDYLGGWFRTPLKLTGNAEETDGVSVAAAEGTNNKCVFDDIEVKRSTILSHRRFDDIEPMNSPAKRFKFSDEKVDIDFPISPIPSTSGLFQSTINHTFDIPKSEDFASSVPGPSSLQTQRYSESNNRPPATSSSGTDVKANGATDNHSDSSESTSGCSSLVPQSDRLSQSAYVCSSRKRNLEEKLNYARQLQQSRASMYLNRSIPLNDALGGRKKPSFDVTAYGTPSFDKSLLKEKLMNSPFYTGQTSYGGASAYRLSRNSFYSFRNSKASTERREGMQVEVKPSHHGSTEELTNMSHTAKKILEALEQFSTPINDAKRIPTSRTNVPLGSKRRRFDDLTESRMKLSTPISPLNPNPGPVITGLNVPTVPDLLKLKRLERIQNSTAAARQVAVQKQKYSLPSDLPPAKRTGKITTKLKDKDKGLQLEKFEEVNLPKIPLPITTLPKFDFQLPSVPQPISTKTEETKKVDQRFTFSNPIPVSVAKMPERSTPKNSFTFSDPLKAEGKKSEPEKSSLAPLTNFMSGDAVAKLKRKSINDVSVKSVPAVIPSVPTELKTGSVMDFLNKSAGGKNNDKESSLKSPSGTWECGSCLIRNLNESKICRSCKASRVVEEKARTLPSPPKVEVPVTKPTLPAFGFGDKFKPPSGSWSCKECFVNNNASADKCIACETPKVPAAPPKKETSSQPPPVPPAKLSTSETPKPAEKTTGFGDLFKKQANQWECSVCMIRNKETDTKCAACETPKPGSKPEKVEPKFTFGIPPASGGFKFGIDKAETDTTGVKSVADSSTFKVQSNGPQAPSEGKPPQLNAISTSVGVFTFGIPPAAATKEKKEEPSRTDNNVVKTTSETTSNSSGFMVTSTSGSGFRKDAPLWEQTLQKNESQTLTVDSKDDKTEEKSASELNKAPSEAPKPFFFGAQSKPLSNPFGGPALQETKNAPPAEPEIKPSKFFFGSSSNSLETVSSSTTDLFFAQPIADPKSSQQAQTRDFPVPFGVFSVAPTPPTNPVEIGKTETPASIVSTSAATTSGSMFGSSSLFNNPPAKMAFGTPSSSSSTSLGFGSSKPLSEQSFTTPAFEPKPSVSSANSFGTMTRPTEQPPLSSANVFGGGAGPFSNVSIPFASTVTPSTNPAKPCFAPAKPFGGFGASASTFGSLPAPAASAPVPTPAFGSGFAQSPTATENPPASMPTGTSASSSGVAPPGVFTFGASKPDPKPTPFTFGQSNTQNFNFGATPSATNIFGGIAQQKPQGSVAATSSPFVFGQSSAPPPETATPVFQFGASPAQPQPATAPPDSGFSLYVPQKFNFTGGQTPVFRAESPSVARSDRIMIKAVRRTKRDGTRRGN